MIINDQLLLTLVKLFCCLFVILGFCHDFISASRRILLGDHHDEIVRDSNKKSS